MKKKILKGYICGTDPLDISLGASIVVYPTIQSLKRKRTCWRECGILEIKIDGIWKVKGTL